MYSLHTVYCLLALQSISGSFALFDDPGVKIVRREVVRREDSTSSDGIPPEISSAAASITSVAGHVAKQGSGDKNSLLSEVQEDIAKATSKAAGQHPIMDAALTPALTAAAAKVTSAASKLQEEGHSGLFDYAKSNIEKATAELKGGSSRSTESSVGSGQTRHPGGTSGTESMTTELKHPLATEAAAKRGLLSDIKSGTADVSDSVSGPITSATGGAVGAVSTDTSSSDASDTSSSHHGLNSIKSIAESDAGKATSAVAGAADTVASDAAGAAHTAKSDAEGAVSTASDEISKHRSDASTLRSDASKATSVAGNEAQKVTIDAGEAAHTAKNDANQAASMASEEVSKHKSDASTLRSDASKATSAADNEAHKITSDAGEAAHTAKSEASDATRDAGEAVHTAKSEASKATSAADKGAHEATSGAGEAAHTAKSEAGKATSAVDSGAHEATSNAGEAAHTAKSEASKATSDVAGAVSTASEDISKHKSDVSKVTSDVGGAAATATSDIAGAITTASQDISKHKSGSDDSTVTSGPDATTSSPAASKRNVWSDIQSGWEHMTGKAGEDWEKAKWQTVNADGKSYCVKDSTSLPYTTSNDMKMNTKYGICAPTPNGAPVATLTAEPMQTTMESATRSAGTTT